jgi:hypothetical protein
LVTIYREISKVQIIIMSCIQAGFLYKKGKVVKSIKMRWFRLDREYLHYFKSPHVPTLFQEEEDKKMGATTNIEEQVQGSRNNSDDPYTDLIDSIPLRNIRSVETNDQVIMIDGVEHYEFILNTKGRRYYLYSSTRKERDNWISVIRNQINQLT